MTVTAMLAVVFIAQNVLDILKKSLCKAVNYSEIVSES